MWNPISSFPRDGEYRFVRDPKKKLKILNYPPNCHLGEWEKSKSGEWHGSFSTFEAVEWAEIPKNI